MTGTEDSDMGMIDTRIYHPLIPFKEMVQDAHKNLRTSTDHNSVNQVIFILRT